MRTIALAPSARRIALALALLLTASLSLLAVGDVSARAGGQQPRMSGDVDLRRGAVYGLSNDPAGNRVVAFSRSSDGTLAPAGSFATKGTGSGGFEDSANGLVLGSARGEAAPNNLLNYGRLLFATNAGSDNLSVFRVHRRKLALVEVQDSRGAKPVSVTVNRGVVYALNSGETVDGLTPRNCTQGARPSVTGFRVTDGGQLTPIPGSTRQLSGDRESGCAQVSFNPSGEVLMVTERFARTAGQASGDEGVINTFVVKANGTLGRQRIFDATGQGPFGFTFNKRGALLTTEQFDGILGPGRGAVAGYTVSERGRLRATSRSVHNGGTDTCWFVVTDDGKYGYTTSFFGEGQISSYRVGDNGSLRLLQAKAADPAEGEVHTGASDLALSRYSRYLYQLNSFDGTISAFRIAGDGRLMLLQVVQAHPGSGTAAPLGIAAS